jgi:type IV pilus assembly protein PilC
MPKYRYVAKDKQGKEFRGIVESKDKDQAQIKLNQLGLYSVFLEEAAAKARFGFLLQFLRAFAQIKIGKVDLSLFAHQFSAMISAGLPLVKCLSILASDTDNKILKTALDEVIFDVQNGLSLSAALAKHPRIFSNFFVSMIKSGETAGILPGVLKRIAIHLEKETELRQKITSAFAYPIVVAFVAIGAIIFLLIFIIPVFVNVYKGLHVNLPLPTLSLIWLSNIMIRYWWLVFAVIIAIIYGFKRIKEKNKRLSFFLDYFKLWMPIFGKLNRKIYTTRFIRTLGAMLASGVTLSRSLEVADEVLSNRVSSAVIRALQININQGKTLTEILEKQRLFSPLAVQMIATGEQSGTLEEMLNKTADFLDEDIDHIIKRLIIKLEPLLTFLVAILVGYIALAIYLPMFDILHNVGAR